MKQYSLEKFKEKRKNKKMLSITILTILILIILVIVALYIANRSFRTFIDKYILRKELTEKEANTLVIDTENLSLIYAYDKNIVIYDDGNIIFYNAAGKQTENIEMTLSRPIADSQNKYIALGDYGSQKICLIKSNNLIWQKDIEGKVSKISVNKNGYVAVSITGTTYESIVMLYNPKGELLFSKYLSTYVMETEISEDNQYLAIAEIDNSRISPSTKIEIISVEKATTNSEKATVNTYEAGANEMITGLKYQKKNQLLCSFDSYILKITENSTEKIYENTNLTAYVGINLDRAFFRVDKEESSVFKSDYRLKLNNTAGKEKTYIIEGSIKDVTDKGKIIALNLGKEVQFVNYKGWLVKKYISNQEIKNVIISNKIGIMIYNDKIDIINL